MRIENLDKNTNKLRYFIAFSYNGASFFGFQIQPNEISVQETLEKALSVLLREDIKITGAGRTDTGVHAKKCMHILKPVMNREISLCISLIAFTTKYCRSGNLSGI